MDEPDWRTKVTATLTENVTLPWSGQRFFRGDRVNLVSVIDLPKKRELTITVPDLTALYINSSCKAWKAYREIRSKKISIRALKKV